MPSNFDVSLRSSYTFSRPDGSSKSTSSVTDGTRQWQTTSGVKRRKPSGWIPPTGYSLAYREYQRASGTCKNVPDPSDLSIGQLYTGCVGMGRFNSLNHFDQTVMESATGDYTALVNAALIAARNQLKGSRVNLGIAFAERNRTAKLLGDTAFQIGKAYGSLRKGHVRDAMNRLGISSKKREPRGANAPRKWLELQYGWKPLLSDVYGSCKALQEEPKGNWRVTAKGQAQASNEWKTTFTSYDSGVCTAKGWRGAFVRIDALPENELLIALSSVGVTNPLLIGWELVPFSFVVDWAFPVGSWLESLDSLLGYGSAYTSTSTLKRVFWDEYGTTRTLPNGDLVTNSYNGHKRMVILSRTASSGVPLPTFPRIKDPASLGHMANGLALLASAFSRKPILNLS